MSTPPLRLFFAIPCSPQLARDIVDWRDRNPLEGKPVAPENLHLTLAFLGSQPRGQVEALAALAASLTPTAFTLPPGPPGALEERLAAPGPKPGPASPGRPGAQPPRAAADLGFQPGDAPVQTPPDPRQALPATAREPHPDL